MLLDPVCKMRVVEDDAEDTSSYKGKTYYFCSEECKDKFDQDPEEFLRVA